MSRAFSKVALIGATLVAGVLFYAHKIEPSNVEVKYVPFMLPRLDREFDGYRIVQISDIHMDGWMSYERLSRLVGLVNEQRPDPIAITGDFVTAGAERDERDLIDALSALEAADGAVAVLGNHDYIADQDLVRGIIRDSGVVELSNDLRTLRRGDGILHIAGVDDFYQRRARLDLILKHLPEEGAAILLAHEPDFAEVSAPTGRFDAQLSGHSHGGRFQLPFVGAVMRPRVGRIYPSGLYNVDGMVQYTNWGLGMIKAQLRFNCRPEITVLTPLTRA